jgi:hypothetical protein
MTRGLGGPRVENDGRGGEAEGGLSAPVAGTTYPRQKWFLGMQKTPLEASNATLGGPWMSCG